MTTHLDHLVDDGLVHRRPHPFDDRRYVVDLTPTGAATVKDAAAAMERVQSASRSAWTTTSATI